MPRERAARRERREDRAFLAADPAIDADEPRGGIPHHAGAGAWRLAPASRSRSASDEASAAIMPSSAAICSGSVTKRIARGPNIAASSSWMLTSRKNTESAGERRGHDVPDHARRELGDVLGAHRHEVVGNRRRHRHGGDEHPEELQQRQQAAERLLARGDRQRPEHQRIAPIRRQRSPHDHRHDARPRPSTKSMWNACDCSSARSRISGSSWRIDVARMCAQ